MPPDLLAPTPVASSPAQLALALQAYIGQLGLNPQQTEACFTPASTALRVLAGAGTGKTMVITARTMALLATFLEDTEPEPAAFTGIEPQHRLLVLTFTDKAANEMLERLEKHLTLAGCPGLIPSKQTVSTFHRFCKTLLSRHALLAGLPPDFTLCNSTQQEAHFNGLLEQIKQGLTPNIASALAFAGLDAEIDPKILSLEALGQLPFAAKSALIEGFVGLIKQIKAAGLSPKSFREEARSQCLQLTKALKTLPCFVPGLQENFSTKESLLQSWAQHVKPWAETSWLKAISEPNLDYKYYVALFEPFYKKSKIYVDTNASRANKVVAFATVDFTELDRLTTLELTLIDQVAAFYALYEQRLSLNNTCDMDDLINRSRDLLQNQPALKAYYQQYFKAVLVDEFQDTNGSQLQLLQQLIRGGQNSVFKAPNLTVVGDEKQSIYGFRFAQRENLTLIFEGLEPVKTVALQANYRSQPPIVAVANLLAANLTANDPNQQLTVGLSSPSKPEPAVYWLTLGDASQNRPAVSATEDRLIALEAARLVVEEGLKPSQIAVLVRGHARATQIGKALNQVGLPYLRSQDKGFFEEPVVRNALALWRLLVDITDERSWVRVLQTKLSQLQVVMVLNALRKLIEAEKSTPGLKTETSTLLAQLATQLAQSAPQQLNAPTQAAITDLLTGLAHFSTQAKELSGLEVAKLSLEEINLLPLGTEPFEQEQARVHQGQLLGLLNHLDRQEGPGLKLEALLSQLEAEASDPEFKLNPLEEVAQNTQAIRLLTIHGSKGLEFEAVFVSWSGGKNNRSQGGDLRMDPQYLGKAGFGLFVSKLEGFNPLKPLLYKDIWQKPRAQSEDERLFYVAVTRARSRLYLLRGQKSAAFSLPFNPAQPFPSQVFVWDEDVPEEKALIEERFNLQQALSAFKTALQPVLTAFAAQQANPALALVPGLTPLLKQVNHPQAEPLTLSFTALSDWQQCPTLYAFKHSLRLPPPALTNPLPSKAQRASVRGNVLHRWMEAYYRYQGQPAEALLNGLAQPLLSLDDTDWQPDWQWLKTSLAALNESQFGWQALQSQGLQVIAPEQKVQYRWPKAIQTANGTKPVLLIGQIDAVFYNPQSRAAVLVDFKTNQRLGAPQLAQYSLQLALYQQGLAQSNPGIQLSHQQTWLAHLTPQATVKATSLSQIEAQVETQPLSQWLETTLNSLESWLCQPKAALPRPDLTLNTQPPCQRCAYRPVCPYQQG